VWRTTWRQALTALNIGWDLGLPIVGGTVIGHHLDSRSGTGYSYTLGGMTLGLGVGVYNVVRTLQRASRQLQPGSSHSPHQDRAEERFRAPAPDRGRRERRGERRNACLP
jgi:F0F1-type ATP synthase assembly protein I